MPNKSHVIIITITIQGQIVQNIDERIIERSFSRAKWSTCGLQIHLPPAKGNVLGKALHCLAVRGDNNFNFHPIQASYFRPTLVQRRDYSSRHPEVSGRPLRPVSLRRSSGTRGRVCWATPVRAFGPLTPTSLT